MWALTELGGRDEVLPARTAGLAELTEAIRTWPADSLPVVLDDLAAHDQVVLFVQVWERIESGLQIRPSLGLDWTEELDFDLPWDDVVGSANGWGHSLAQWLPHPKDLVVSLRWIDHGDL